MSVECKPRVLVVDDEASVRASLIGYLDDRSMRTLSAANGREAIESIIHEKPDVVLLDLDLPEIDGLEVLRRARMYAPDSAIIMMSGRGTMGDVIESLRLGASDYISKPIHDLALLDVSVKKAVERIQIHRENLRHRENLEELVNLRTAELENANRALEAKNVAFREIVAGGESERSKIGHQVSMNIEGEALSEREREVLRLVAEGKSSKEIAAQLYVTTKTIVWHRQSIMGKLELRSIAELTKYAVRTGLTTLDY